MIEASERRSVPEYEVNPKHIALAGITRYGGWYPGELRDITHTEKVRGDLTLDFLRSGIAHGHQMVIADGGSSKEFLAELRELPIIFVKRGEPGRAAGRRQAISVSAMLPDVKAIIRTETEKIDIAASLASRIAAPLVRDEADIVIPRRDPRLFAETYPENMHESEVKANELLNSLLHDHGHLDPNISHDFFFGPQGIRNDESILGLYMEKHQFLGKREWGARKYMQPEEFGDGYTFPVIKAIHKGLRVVALDVPFRYPSLQQQNEEVTDHVDKRKGQRFGIVDEAVHFLRLLNGGLEIPKGKIAAIL